MQVHPQTEEEKARQEYLLLDSIGRSNDYRTLKEMNGNQCSGRQVSHLRLYERPQKVEHVAG
jgi:hypothetical protein